MIRPRSIRWTLLFWYAVVLVASLAVLGWTLHDDMDRRLYRGVDAELDHWTESALHWIDGYQGADVARKFRRLPAHTTHTVWDEAGRVVSSTPGLEPPRPLEEARWTENQVRVVTVPTNVGGWLRLGLDVEDEHDRIRGFLVLLFAASGAIIVVALLGGWWLVGRALRPLADISDAASRISGENPDTRIDVTRIENELSALARVLNATFDRLEGAIERQARFTADASHELRTPLTILRSHLELAQEPGATVASLQERSAICHDAVLRMQKIVEGLLTLARGGAGELEIELDEVDLASLVEEVAVEIAPLAAERGISVETRLDPVVARGDRARLHEVLMNLCANAVHYNEDGGRVDVTLTRDGDDAVLAVTDTGIGIAPEDQERIFERFFRVDASRSSARGGSGLGLAIARWVVTRHGGEVSVRSTPGEGTTFEVRLPVAGPRPA